MIAVVDYGLGNLRSVVGALEFLGATASIVSDARELDRASKLILPGVGSFRAAMENIERRGLRDAIIRNARQNQKPLLGICLGMQLLATTGEEDGPTPGLDLVPGEVRHLRAGAGQRVPHVGFNDVELDGDRSPLFTGLGARADFYFVHSYAMTCTDPSSVSGWCDYGERFCASVTRGNVHGTQFHPEKSQTNGLRILHNFVQLSA